MSLAISKFAVVLLLFALALAAAAQPTGTRYRIAAFHVGDHAAPGLLLLRDRLRAMGYEEGRNLELQIRNVADEQAASRTARAFVEARVDLIVAFGDLAVRAAKAATSEIPIVMIHAADPVALGLVDSLARPGGNVTGFVFYAVSAAKQLELLKEIIPGLRRVLVLVDPRDPTTPAQRTEVRRAAGNLQVTLIEREAMSEKELEQVFGAIKRGDVDGVIAASNSLHIKFTAPLIRFASEKHAALASYRKESVAQGALFSYAPDTGAVERRAATVVAKILKGAKPSDFPVEEPSKFELTINLRTAKALGATIPPSVLVRADEVIR